MGAEHKGKGVNVQVRRRLFSLKRGYIIGGEGQLTDNVLIFHTIARTDDEYGTSSCWW